MVSLHVLHIAVIVCTLFNYWIIVYIIFFTHFAYFNVHFYSYPLIACNISCYFLLLCLCMFASHFIIQLWHSQGSVISVFTWISKQYSYFYTFYWYLMSNYSFFYNTCYKSHTPEKWHFMSLQSLLLPLFSTYRHWTEFIVKRKQVCITNYLGIPINWWKNFLQIFKVIILPQKIWAFQKPHIIYYSFLFKKR